MNQLRRLLPALALFSIAACSGQPDSTAASDQEPPLAGASIGGDFTLTSEAGETVHASDFDGDYRLVYFGYTFCPDVCPVDMQKLGQGMRALEQDDPDLAARVQPIFISVDPQRDTAEVLAQFTDNFYPRLLGLTGTKEQIDAVTDAYGSYYSIDEPSEDGGYLVNHSSNILLFGPEGAPLAVIPSDGTPEQFAAEIERWAT